MIDTPKILETTTRPTAIIRLTVPRADMPKVMGPAMKEVSETLREQGITPSGPFFCHHMKMDPGVFDFEVGVVVPTAVTPKGRVINGELPKSEVAQTIYRGPYEGLPNAWPELLDWIKTQGRAVGPSLWETYVKGPGSSPDPSTWETELTRPLVD